MSDALELIAEAQKRQKEAERNAEHWKKRYVSERARCKAVIAAAKRRPIDPPQLHDSYLPDWKWTAEVVSEFVQIIQDPHAAFSDDGYDMTHDQARAMISYRIEDAIKAAITAHILGKTTANTLQTKQPTD